MDSAFPCLRPAALAVSNYVYAATQNQDFVFWFLFGFRYVRLIVHIIAYVFVYKPTPIPAQPNYSSADCTVIVPTVDPLNEDFNECLQSILMNSPAAVIIATIGRANKRACESVVKQLQKRYPATNLTVLTTEIASKRRQVCAAIPHVNTSVTVLADDHVFWPSLRFLPTVLAPFEDTQVGCVGTVKKVRRALTGLSFRSFFNFLGCVYLERHNFELAATNALDGGVFVVSGRTSVIRTSIVQDPAFMNGFANEMFFFGQFGPLNADDDNFITRWLVTKKWKIKFQSCPDATVETTLGTYPKFLSQCLRWVRTTWRSNSASLFTDGTVWLSQPWCVYAVYITSFFNFALFYDAALTYTLCSHTSFGNTKNALCFMTAWIFASKMVKLIPHFLRCPADVIFFPGYIVFAYYHSFLKLYAFFTFYVTAWGGRNLAAVGSEADSEVCREKLPVIPDLTAYNHNPDLLFSISEGSSNCASSTTWRSPSSPRSSNSSLIRTPWGPVRRKNTLYQPANVLESQIPTPPRIERKKGDKSSPSSSTSNRSDHCSMTVSSGTSQRKLSQPSFNFKSVDSPSGRSRSSSLSLDLSNESAGSSKILSTIGLCAERQLQQELAAHALPSMRPSRSSSAVDFCTGSHFDEELCAQVGSWAPPPESPTKAVPETQVPRRRCTRFTWASDEGSCYEPLSRGTIQAELVCGRVL